MEWLRRIASRLFGPRRTTDSAVPEIIAGLKDGSVAFDARDDRPERDFTVSDLGDRSKPPQTIRASSPEEAAAWAVFNSDGDGYMELRVDWAEDED